MKWGWWAAKPSETVSAAPVGGAPVLYPVSAFIGRPNPSTVVFVHRVPVVSTV
jgi:hypothetical protein